MHKGGDTNIKITLVSSQNRVYTQETKDRGDVLNNKDGDTVCTVYTPQTIVLR